MKDYQVSFSGRLKNTSRKTFCIFFKHVKIRDQKKFFLSPQDVVFTHLNPAKGHRKKGKIRDLLTVMNVVDNFLMENFK